MNGTPSAAGPTGGPADAATGRLAVVGLAGAGWFVVGANINLMPPLLAFVASDLRLSPTMQGLMMAAMPLGSLLGNVLLGPHVDAVGARRTFVAGACAVAVTLAATAAVSDGAGVSALRLLTGVFAPLVGVSVFSLVAQHVGADRQTSAIGLVTAAGSLANLLTAPAALLLAAYFSWHGPVLALAVLAAVVAIAGLAVPPARRPPDRQRRRLGVLTLPSQPGVRPVVGVFALFTFAQMAIVTIYPTWLLTNLGRDGRAADRVGLLLLAGGAVMVVAAALTGTLARRAGRALFGVVLGAPVVVALLLPVAPRAYPVQLVGYAALVGLQALAFPLLRARANRLAGDELSRTNASINAGYQIAATAAAFLAAFLYSFTPSLWLNTVVASLCFLCAVVVFFGARVPVAAGRAEAGTGRHVQ